MSMKRTDYAAALGMFIYASSVVATPIVLLRMADELTFGLAEGGGIEAVRAFFLLIIMIFSGVAAIRFGKTVTLGTGALVLAAGLFAYAAAPLYLVVLGAIVLVGLGGGILEALINPLIQDEHPEDSGRYLNLINAFFSVGVFTSVLVVGELLTRGVSWRLLIAGLGIIAVASAILFFLSGPGTVHRRERVQPRGTTRGVAAADAAVHGDIPVWAHAGAILRQKQFWLFAVAMFCGGGAEGAFTFWSASYVQLNLGVLARGGAVATAAFAGGMVVGRVASGHLVRQEQLHLLIIGSAVTGVAASLAAWAVSGMVAFVGIVFAAGLTIACFWPSIQSYAATLMPVDSTTLFILLSCGGIPGFGLTSWMMGFIAERYGLRNSLLVIPMLLSLLAVVMVRIHRNASAPSPAASAHSSLR
jgi:fucose permease